MSQENVESYRPDQTAIFPSKSLKTGKREWTVSARNLGDIPIVAKGQVRLEACAPGTGHASEDPKGWRASDAGLERYFTTRALGAAVAAGVLALAGIFVFRDDARYVYDGLVGEALPLVILSALCGAGVVALLLRHVQRGARVLAIGAVASVIWGWGAAQYPYLLPEKLTISAGAADHDSLVEVLLVFGVAVILVLPALGLLYVLTQRSVLEE